MALPLLLSMLGGGMAKAGVLGAAGSFLANPMVASALGSGLGTAIQTGDLGRGLGSGIGSLAGGHLMNSLMPNAGMSGSNAMATNPVSGPMETSMRPMARPDGLGTSPGILGSTMDFGTSPMGIGSMAGGMLGGTVGADMLGLSSSSGSGSGNRAGVPSMTAVPPMQRSAATAPPGFQPGMSPEFGYGVSTPYTSEYVQQYAPQNMAAGGTVRQRMVPQYGPVRMQAGGIADVAGQPVPNEKEVISAAVAAIKGTHPQPEMALGMFLSQFGEEALRDLVDRVQSGDMSETQARGEGQVAGPGDGMNDRVPANINGQEDVLLSDGEYIVPADVVSGLGNGSTDAGAKALDGMRDRVREARTGRREQAPEIPQEQMMPL
jgi:hypothetical protein